jgi:hypothetical protein
MTTIPERMVPLKVLRAERTKVRARIQKLEDDLRLAHAQNAALLTLIEQNPSFSISACANIKASFRVIP